VRRRVNDACLTSIEIHFNEKGIANKLRARRPLKFPFALIVFGNTWRSRLIRDEKLYPARPSGILIYKVHDLAVGRGVETEIAMDEAKETIYACIFQTSSAYCKYDKATKLSRPKKLSDGVPLYKMSIFINDLPGPI